MAAVPRQIELEVRIRREIRARGRISFARFMELALYDPQGGYYARGPECLGQRGDFFTASDVGHHFGRCLARQLREIDRLLGAPRPFDVLEFGAGRGLLARDLVDALRVLDPPLAARLRLTLIDRSTAMRRAASRQVPEARVLAPEDVGGGHCGCVLAVELFDALPAHRVRRRAGRLLELYVGLDEAGRLAETEGPPAPEVERMARRYGAAAREGSEAEVSLCAADQLETMARALDRGVVIIVDYGDRPSQLYGASRPLGTLLAYQRHTVHQRYFDCVGEQDLTALVNFSALEDRATEIGMQVLGLTTQDRFLIANGILESFQAGASDSREPRRVKQRLQALALIHPQGMGRVFKVQLLAKGCASSPSLAGLADPFAGDHGASCASSAASPGDSRPRSSRLC